MVMTLLSRNNEKQQPATPAPMEYHNVLSPEILELLASRICHDLISPVGAVHNGVEFLQEMGAEAGGEAIDLIAHSAEMAAAKLQIFRLAYGAGGRDPSIKPEDVHAAFENMIQLDSKVEQDWDPHGDLGFDMRPDGYIKLLTGALLLAHECLHKGGNLKVTAGPAPDTTHIIAEGTGAVLRDNIDRALACNIEVSALDPRLVHPYVMGIFGDHYNLSLRVAETAAERITFAITARESS